MVGTITLREAIDIMQSGKAFDIEYTEADRQRGTGGRLRALSNVLRTADMPKKRSRKTKAQEEKKHVNPNHQNNYTINIYVPQEKKQDARIKKVHLPLITRINGKDVL